MVNNTSWSRTPLLMDPVTGRNRYDVYTFQLNAAGVSHNEHQSRVITFWTILSGLIFFCRLIRTHLSATAPPSSLPPATQKKCYNTQRNDHSPEISISCVTLINHQEGSIEGFSCAAFNFLSCSNVRKNYERVKVKFFIY